MTLCSSCEGSDLWEIYLIEFDDSDEFDTIYVQCSNCAHVEGTYKVRTDVGVFIK